MTNATNTEKNTDMCDIDAITVFSDVNEYSQDMVSPFSEQVVLHIYSKYTNGDTYLYKLYYIKPNAVFLTRCSFHHSICFTSHIGLLQT
jgi:hypothetical protein